MFPGWDIRISCKHVTFHIKYYIIFNGGLIYFYRISTYFLPGNFYLYLSWKVFPKGISTFTVLMTRCLHSSGKEHNFKKREDEESSALNVPYDYGSVLHYSKTSFNIAEDPTIVTKIPQFMDVIGQRMEFSDNDLLKLNRLYNCSESHARLESIWWALCIQNAS